MKILKGGPEDVGKTKEAWKHLGRNVIGSYDYTMSANGDKKYFWYKKNTAVIEPPPFDMSALDIQEGGDHYRRMKIQPVEFIHANGIPFVEGCVIKYVCRHVRKNGLEDLKKAKHFIDLLIDLEYNQTETE